LPLVQKKLTLGTAQNGSAAAAPREKAPGMPLVQNNSLWAQRKTQVLQLLYERKHYEHLK